MWHVTWLLLLLLRTKRGLTGLYVPLGAAWRGLAHFWLLLLLRLGLVSLEGAQHALDALAFLLMLGLVVRWLWLGNLVHERLTFPEQFGEGALLLRSLLLSSRRHHHALW
jgi:hypothetical protein